jgi:hypothetical protein
MQLAAVDQGRVCIALHTAVADQLKEIAFTHPKPQQALFLEAITILFAK